MIAESMVTSSNFPTKTLKYNRRLLAIKGDPRRYVEARIQKTMAREGRRGLVLMWSGYFAHSAFDELIENPFPLSKIMYLTRLENRIDPEAMTEDIRFKLDPEPRQFMVRSEVSANLEPIAGGILSVFGAIFLIFLAWFIHLFIRRFRQRLDR